MEIQKSRMVSGIQPTGDIHLGNYLGAIRNMVKMQSEHQSIILIADLHALTMSIDPAVLRANSFNTMALLIACGISPLRHGTILATQSTIVGSSGLHWYLECVARVGWLNRMVQFKTKGENAEGESVGLYTYPVLQAADIMLFKGTHVPVGEDQLQHLNLVRDIAEKFNTTYGEIFPVPKAVLSQDAARIMSLRNPLAKMSKSDPDSSARINLIDEPDIIRAKLRKAVTGSTCMPGSIDEMNDLPGIRNLVEIHSEISGEQVGVIMSRHAGGKFGPFKNEVAEVIIEHLAPIREHYHRVCGDCEIVIEQIQQGIDRALDIGDDTMTEVKAAMGIL